MAQPASDRLPFGHQIAYVAVGGEDVEILAGYLIVFALAGVRL
jgi:hypothetical protein